MIELGTLDQAVNAFYSKKERVLQIFERGDDTPFSVDGTPIINVAYDRFTGHVIVLCEHEDPDFRDFLRQEYSVKLVDIVRVKVLDITADDTIFEAYVVDDWTAPRAHQTSSTLTWVRRQASQLSHPPFYLDSF